MFNKNILITFAIIMVTKACDIGDKKPFCHFPGVFKPSMKAADVQLDVQRYMGDWHEVARTYNKYEKGCACSEAHYDFDNEKQFIKVTNSCLKTDGSTNVAHAKAYPKNDNMTIYKLYFVPVFGGNYWILDLADDYSWVMIGEPCRDSLYILSRTVPMHHDVLATLIRKASDIGYNTKGIILRSETCTETNDLGIEA